MSEQGETIPKQVDTLNQSPPKFATATQPEEADNQEHDFDSSQLSNKSFLCSLGDCEFLDLLNKLSQREAAAQKAEPVATQSVAISTQEDNKGFEGDILDEITQDVDEKKSTQIDVIDQSGIDVSTVDKDESLVERALLHHLSQDDPFRDNKDLINEEPRGSTEEDTASFQLRQPDPSETDDQGLSNILFGDYADYFATKGQNQQKQDQEFLEWDDKRREILARAQEVGSNLSDDKDEYSDLLRKRSDILKSCIIYVNGYTKPGIQTLHKLIILNGGKFVHHLSSKGAVTHIICARLTPRKQAEFRNYKVCKPEWIVDSVKQGNLLKWSSYSIIEVGYGQTRLPFGEIEYRRGDNHEELSENANVDAIEEDEEDNEASDEEAQDEFGKLSQQEEIENTGEGVDSKHPNFLKTFFAKSRLHHLSNWKQDLRSEYLQLALSQKTAPPKYRNSKDFQVIMHIDFDCFFAKASSLNHPEVDFDNQPVCVSHASNSRQSLAKSSADVSSCNYVCRKFGVKNGMWVRRAIELCPDLVCLGYDFQKYEEISQNFYDILMSLGAESVYPVSVDEALLDISSLVDENDYTNQIEELCQNLRRRIFDETKCTASVGCSRNVLLAKLSLRKAKPNGFHQQFEGIEDFLDDFDVRDLPGFGRSNENKLQHFFKQDDAIKVKDLRELSKHQLEKLFGSKTASKLFNYARGIDSTSIDVSANPKEFIRKSISIDINWGIRFDNAFQVDKFLYDVAKEIHLKLAKLKLVTSNLTVKILKRAKHAPIEPAKYLGCGECDAFSRSSKFPTPTNDYRLLGTEARSLYRSIGCDPAGLRGIALQVNKLIQESDVVKQNTLNFKKIDLETFNKIRDKESKESINPKPTTSGSKDSSFDLTQFDTPSNFNSSVIEELPSKMREHILRQRSLNNQPVLELPKEVDVNVFQQLPPEIQAEVREELRRRNIKFCTRTNQTPQDKNYIYQQVFEADGKIETIRVLKSPKKKSNSPKKQVSPVKLSSPSPTKKRRIDVDWRQIDEGVFNELPEELRQSILEEYKFYEKANNTKLSLLKMKDQETATLTSKPIEKSTTKPIIEPLRFQKLTRPKKIMNIISQWLESSITEEISSGDVKILDKYMDKLKLSNNALYLLITERIQMFYMAKLNNGVAFSKRWEELMKRYTEEKI